jgi:hypothetical protein
MARTHVVLDVGTGVQTEIPYTSEEEAAADAAYAAEQGLPPVYHINGGALIRFSATNPITIYENLGMAGVARLAKGRYRITHQTPMPTDQYSVFPDVMDIAVKYVRYTARTTDYVEVRVVDATGAAADATEVSVKIERVVSA